MIEVKQFRVFLKILNYGRNYIPNIYEKKNFNRNKDNKYNLFLKWKWQKKVKKIKNKEFTCYLPTPT